MGPALYAGRKIAKSYLRIYDGDSGKGRVLQIAVAEFARCATLALREKPMMQVNATYFKNFLDEFLGIAKDEPVIIHKTGKPIAVVLGIAEYEHLQKLQELYRLARATLAETTSEQISDEELVRFLTERLKQAA